MHSVEEYMRETGEVIQGMVNIESVVKIENKKMPAFNLEKWLMINPFFLKYTICKPKEVIAVAIRIDE